MFENKINAANEYELPNNGFALAKLGSPTTQGTQGPISYNRPHNQTESSNAEATDNRISGDDLATSNCNIIPKNQTILSQGVNWTKILFHQLSISAVNIQDNVSKGIVPIVPQLSPSSPSIAEADCEASKSISKTVAKNESQTDIRS